MAEYKEMTQRTHFRRVFDRSSALLKGHIEKKEYSNGIIEFEYLKETYTSIVTLDKVIQQRMLDEYDEEEFENEITGAEIYKKKFLTFKHTFEEELANKFKKPEEKQPQKLNLPKIELKSFDGNPKNWLSFWGQFKKIHENKTLPREDKFQYLLQGLTENSSARVLVESFPPSGENYEKAMQQLKDRFAKDDVLIQVYVRELLSLVLQKSEILDLKVLYDKLTSYLLALETLDITKQKYEVILYPLVESAIPEELLLIFNRTSKSKQLEPLLDFLKQEVESQESITLARSDFNSYQSSSLNAIHRGETNKPPTATCLMLKQEKYWKPTTQGKDDACCLCGKNNHNIFQCSKATKMTLEQKKQAIKDSGSCFVCFKKSHLASKCKATYIRCICCSKRHYVVLCPLLHSKNYKENTSKNENVLVNHKNNNTLLQTLMVNISHNGKNKKVRAVVDNGSQRTYLKSSVAEELNIKEVGVEFISHTVFGGETMPAQLHKCFEFKVSNLNHTFNLPMIALGQSNLCGHLPKISDENIIRKLKSLNIKVSDIESNDTEIQLLIGSDYLGSIITRNYVPLQGNLVGVETKLGWTICGPTHGHNNSTVSFCMNVTQVSHNDISQLWDMELLGIHDPYQQQSKEETKSEILKCFNKNISVNAERRYEVSLLWKEGCPEPSSNYEMAQKRLEYTTKKLLSTGNLHNYNNVFTEWKDEGIISLVENDDKEKGHYLPHRAVIKLCSTTTKVRPVFDASAKSAKGLSLNDCIDKGINLIELIPKLLILFRKGAYGVSADIAKAFLQISVNENDRNFIKFLWWKDCSTRQEIVTYKHNRVVFGINCSPFLLSATINYHLDNCHLHVETAEKLKKSFYVDNCITSFDTCNELNTFISQSKEVMALAKFDLRGWVTAPARNQTPTQDVPVLGLTWNIENDQLYLNLDVMDCPEKKVTKRYLLSVTQKIFDPLGMLCPVTIIPKYILQKVWEKKFDWDEEITSDLAKEFIQWQNKLHVLKECKIPRRLSTTPIEQTNVSLHTFCDASDHAFSGCVFLRTEQHLNVHVQLIMAKSRIAPANKNMSLPRLELMGAITASRLYNEVINSELLAQCKSFESHFWTDSTVVIAWLKQQKQWKPFVSNRVKEITSTTNVNAWRHLPGDSNPADLPSRGCNAQKLRDSRWWEGPAWLRLPSDRWPTSQPTRDTSEDEAVAREEKRILVNMNTVSTPLNTQLLHFSKYSKIVRVVAWILRFSPRVRNQFACPNYITNDEYTNAEKTVIKLIQKESFSESSTPSNLNTEVDGEGIIRVKTRLDLSNERKEFVNPILLSGRNEIVRRLVRQRHEILKHAGTQLLMSDLRNDFWILNIRRLAKKTVSDCVICKRYKTKHYEVPEAPLPIERIENVTAFQTSGVDLLGPLILQSQEKCWIALFTCATYRAIHLELVGSLSTNCFLLALRRFTARRGRVNTIFSDNGTNFQGAANMLRQIDWAKVEGATANMVQPIKWRFIPPSAPWWGGWWERLVRVVKEMLRRTLGKASVTAIELETILCDCETIINSRPLTYVPTDDLSLRPLTPIMFLHGLQTSDTPDLDHLDANSANLRLRYMEKLRADFRQRFRNEYIAMLVSRNKIKSRFPSVGDIVLVEADSSRLHWPLGIIKELVTGADGHARVARVQTATGVKVRACQRLYPLELSADIEKWQEAASTSGQGKAVKSDPLSSSSCDLETVTSHDTDETPSSPVSSGPQPTSATTRLGRVVKIPRRFYD